LSAKIFSKILCRGGGWAWGVGAKLNVVQKRWICAVACTSFNFCEALAIFVFCQSVDFVSKRSNAITDNGKRIGEVADKLDEKFNLDGT